MVVDGNYKVARAKCCYDEVYVQTKEFDAIRIGCPNIPERLSYYCLGHKDKELVFLFKEGYRHFKPQAIKISHLGRHFQIKCFINF